MARTFNGNTANRLTRSDALGLTDWPFTFACWAKPVNVTANHGLINFGASGFANPYVYFWLDGATSGDPLRVGYVNPSVAGVNSSNSFNANAWNSCVGVYQSTSATAFLNGTKTTASFSAQTFSGSLDLTGLGVLARSTVAIPMNGDIAWACVWNVALTDAEAQAFCNGAHPYTIRPGNLVAFWPLTGGGDAGEIDQIGGYDLTETGTVGTADSPLVGLGSQIWVQSEAAGGTTHATSGALTGPGSSIVGTAAHIAVHATSGALTGPGATVAGTAARTRAHATTGAITGAGAAIVGSAAHIAIHATSGALAGAGAVITGSAARSAVSEHATSGALVGPGSSIAGSAARTAVHVTSGALTGPGASVVGSAAHIAIHATSGALAGSGAAVTGTAARQATHATSGALVGAGAAVSGTAANGVAAQPAAFVGGGGWGITHSQALRLLERLKKKDARSSMPKKSNLSSICWKPCPKPRRHPRQLLRCSSSRMDRGARLTSASHSASRRLSSALSASTKPISVN